LCNPATQDCTQDPSGPYTSEKECNEKCKRYSCDTSSYTCVPDPAGPYENLAECAAVCTPDKYYCCGPASDPDDRDCYSTPCGVGYVQYGVYDTPEECDDKCKVTHYKCNTDTYDCTEDPTGPYTDLQVCKDNCKDTQYYCCEDADGVKTCRQEGCEFYGENQVGGPYIDDIECADDCKTLYYCCQDATGERSCHPGRCPNGTTTVGVYTDETDCDSQCPVYYVCAQKTPYPVDGYECVAFSDAIDPSLILNQYETPDCDGECPPDPVYFCCEDASGDKDCYKYGCPPDQTEAGGPYSTPRECSTDCGVKYYCCEDSDGNKTCRDDECEYYGENEVGGPYDTKDLCEPECEKYYCCEDSNGERNCYKGNCPAGTEEKGGPYDDDVACKEAACAKVYWYCTAPDACESGDSGPYDSEDACLDGAPEDCKEAYTCQDNGDGTKTCVQDPDGEYDTDDCGGNCDKPKKYACVDDQCVPDDNGPYDEDTCGGNCVKPECVVDSDCGCDAPDTYFEGHGCCQDGQVPKPGTNQCWEDGRPGTETSLVATGECCNGQCVELCIGGCCTEYGLSYVSRKQCKEWGGTFYEPGEAFDTTCGCDCAGIGGTYCVANGVPCGQQRPDAPTHCGPSPLNGFESDYYTFDRVEQGGTLDYFCENNDCSPLDDLRAKGARLTGWSDYVSETNSEANSECCIGFSTVTRFRYRMFALNCRKKEWEEAPNVMAFANSDSQGSNLGAACTTGPAPAAEPPTAPLRFGRPTCIPRVAENPLP
jgi:hypothetical protein